MNITKINGVFVMRYERLSHYVEEEFRRLTGIKRDTFNKMVEILKKAESIKKSKGGKPHQLAMEDRLLMALEYLREYRTYFHVTSTYGIKESTCYRNRWIEATLIKHPDFALPGRKVLLKSEVEYEVVLIDAAEPPIERPKKSKNTFTQGRRKNIL